MGAFGQIYVTQARIFFRDRVTLAVTVALPLILSAFFGLLFGSTDTAGLKAAVVASDSSQTTTSVVEGLLNSAADGSSGGGKLELVRKDEATAMAALKQGDLDLVLIFPPISTTAVAGESPAVVTYAYNSGNAQTAGTARLVGETVVARLNVDLAGGTPRLAAEPVDVASHTPTLSEFYIPNFLAISTLWLSIFATALPLVRQREEGCLLRIGIAPVSKVTFMAGVTAWRLTVGVLQSALFAAVAVAILRLDVLGRWPLFLAAVVVGNLVLTLMGYMIASLAGTVARAEGTAQLFNFAFMFLSGVFFTADMLPEILTKISYAIPLTYLADLFRQLMVGYPPIFPLWVCFAVLGGWGVVFGGVALKAWRWK